MLILALLACSDYRVEQLDDTEITARGTLDVSPSFLDFDLLELDEVGTASFTVTSVGETAVRIGDISRLGSPAFTLVGDAPETLLPGDSFTVDVTYHPDAPLNEGWVHIASDALPDLLEVGLRGGGIVPVMALDPGAVELQSLQGETVFVDVLVKSVGTAPLVVDDQITVADPTFTVDQLALPLTLDPGESTTLRVTWEPWGTPEAEGDVWFANNTPTGRAHLPLHATLRPPCLGLAEAWDTGVLEARYASTFELANHSPTDDVCIDRWTVWLTETSQDLGAGDPWFDPGGDYPLGTLVLKPGDRLVFPYSRTEQPTWYCMEETQIVSPTTNFEFLGSRVPEPLLGYMLGGDQDAVWRFMQANPVVVAGRDTHVVHPGDRVVLHAVNMGRMGTTARLSERIPAGWKATNWTEAPVQVDTLDGGDRIFWFEHDFAAAIDTDIDSPTIYDEHWIAYTLENDGAPCPWRAYHPEPSATWWDARGVERWSVGSPLLVTCAE